MKSGELSEAWEAKVDALAGEGITVEHDMESARPRHRSLDFWEDCRMLYVDTHGRAEDAGQEVLPAHGVCGAFAAAAAACLTVPALNVEF